MGTDEEKPAKVRWMAVVLMGVSLFGGVYVFRVVSDDRRADVVTESFGEVLEKAVYAKIRVGGKELRVEVADTPAKITKGLGYRDTLGAEGMLFVFPRAHVPVFWMKGMRFGLDMVWISCVDRDPSTVLNQTDSKSAQDETTDLLSLSIVSNVRDDGCKVVDVTEKIPAPRDPENPVGMYQPRSEVTHVLEVPMGWVEENQVVIGNEVVVNLEE